MKYESMRACIHGGVANTKPVRFHTDAKSTFFVKNSVSIQQTPSFRDCVGAWGIQTLLWIVFG